jgi:hypothetical protein
MPKYLVDFSAWIEVTAKDEDDALDVALAQIEILYPKGPIGIGDIEETE